MSADERPVPVVDDEPEPTAEELRLAEELRRGLDGDAPSFDVDFARRLAVMTAPSDLDELAHERILRAALAKEPRGSTRRAVVVSLSVVVAAAAALAVVAHGERDLSHTPVAPQLARRSTEELFTGPAGPGATTTERVERIAHARARDLRENRFARWGVR